MLLRLLSLLVLIALWQAASMVADTRLLPPPLTVLAVMGREAHTRALYFNLADDAGARHCRLHLGDGVSARFSAS